MSGLAHPKGEDRSFQRIGGLKLILRCDAGPITGLGHVKRCIALAEWLDDSPVFALADTPAAVLEQVGAAGYQAVALPRSFDERAAALRNLGAHAVVLDIANTQSRLAPDSMRQEVKALLGLGLPAAFIDGVNTDALADAELAAALSLCVRPYPGAVPEAKGRWLVGADYFIVSRGLALASLAPRKIEWHAKRILVTTGGSDIGALGPRIVRELNGASEQHFEVRVVIGPLVPDATRRAVHAESAASPHRIEICEGRNDLIADMQWCDMAVASTGLTKYELALNAVPSVLISPDRNHEMNNRSFRDCDTALDLGVAGSLPPGAIREACVGLAQDMPLRARLSERSRKLIDGKGAPRFLAALKSLIDAR
jgi:UDP-2,4-diacetamido-2,4,6-trideoxy-beta-L-altropyranose hydrolase